MTTTKRLGKCSECGSRIQKNGRTWKHQRPQPDGSPWTHKAKESK